MKKTTFFFLVVFILTTNIAKTNYFQSQKPPKGPKQPYSSRGCGKKAPIKKEKKEAIQKKEDCESLAIEFASCLGIHEGNFALCQSLFTNYFLCQPSKPKEKK